MDSQFAFGLTNPFFLWAVQFLFLFWKIFQIGPCLPAIPAVQDTMMDSNTAATAGEFHIFLWEILLVGEAENEDIYRHFPKMPLYHPTASLPTLL